jgi:ABC-2 type transport system ATP-binding protein
VAAITVDHLTKTYGAVVAVDDLSFALEPGTITGFLGRNGAGKTTTLRTLLGLAAPTSGSATFGGRRMADLPDPARTVGAVLDARFHPGRRARDHLLALATAARIPASRVDEVLGMVGLSEVGRRRVGGYSLGMRQRLALAAALLGDPAVLLLDEPTNGLDPDGVLWLRRMLRSFRDEGRTVLVSSHLLAEVAQTVDDVVIVDRGRLVAQLPVTGLDAGTALHVRTPDAPALHAALAARGIAAEPVDGGVEVRGATPEEVGRAVAEAGAVVYEMRPVERSLEDLFFSLTERSGR